MTWQPSAAPRRRRKRGGLGSAAIQYGLLNEPTATNVLPQTTDLSSWTSSGVGARTRTPGQAIRSSTYGVLLPMESSSSAHFTNLAATFAASTRQVISTIWKPAVGVQAIRLQLYNNTAAAIQAQATFTVSGGAIVASALSGATILAAGGYDYGGGFYRLWIALTSSAAAADTYAFSYLGDTGAVAGDSCIVGLPQVESIVLTSPIPNATAGTVTRNSDAISAIVLGAVLGANRTIFQDHLIIPCYQPSSNHWLTRCTAGANSNEWGLYNGADTNYNFTAVSETSTPNLYPTYVQRRVGMVARLLAGTAGTALRDVYFNNASVRSSTSGTINDLTGGAVTINFGAAAPRVMYRYVVYNSDLGAAAAQALSVAGAAHPSGAAIEVDYRSGVLPGGQTVGRTSSGLDGTLTLIAAGLPRWAVVGVPL